jgi:hypothetical protein
VQVRFGSNENQRSHTFRYVLDAGLDHLAVQQAIELHLRTVPLLDGLNRGKLEINGRVLLYHAFRFPDGNVNVGRITIANSDSS